ncbi:metallopeptidase TldD-related protein [Mycolicibacterium smegmatis]|uniref:metallopeptidase TldD-related protein n=1 Tax=Mycolicibacterium smegmatis TaxID=1772 RepID=UPI0005D9DB03|nr:metallopeptidase TldD-related protein [Mycolicibacterium smegmatis]MDF1902593.1 metallopeptidase TldD-related protein [Mycolicibacterium smegmatis]MDF1908483.1 metallopeptidase TldD-related protein [Mycolicibacterium smegmatis]MDF1920980.1 metallopeptidase TldD-related protein [Mycolicibacterium smegmatis]MDF1927050.1 metallopeptidase TldD-related protein [Mycolicibacterium smegmatis]UAK56110.1 TldD/PmbA family protein [Mycolicibacterium smegmatis]
MIGAQQVVDIALGAADSGTETIVVVTDRADASLRWANNSMTTNGETVSRNTTVISIVRRGSKAHVGSMRTSDVDPAVIPDLVAAAQRAALDAPEARDAAPPLPADDGPADWDAPVPGTGAQVFTGIAPDLAKAFRGTDQLYGYARHVLETTFVATSTGLRRRYTQPTGSVEINAKRNGASAWAGVSTADFLDVQVDSLLDDLSLRLGWAERTVELPAGRYETIMPPSTVADMMIYLTWTMDGRGAHEGRTALSAPGGTRVGEKLTDLPLTLYSDPFAESLECQPFVAVPSSSERVSIFDNGMDIGRVDWIKDGVINALAYPRAVAAEYNAPVTAPADNLLMTGGTTELADMIAATERGLLLTTLWYIRVVDPTVLLLTGLTRDGVYLIEDGEVTAAVNNFRFNESPLDLLRRASEAGISERTLPREWGDWATRSAMPTLRIPDFHMSSVSQAQ